MTYPFFTLTGTLLRALVPRLVAFGWVVMLSAAAAKAREPADFVLGRPEKDLLAALKAYASGAEQMCAPRPALLADG